jgi:hypothetical protein
MLASLIHKISNSIPTYFNLDWPLPGVLAQTQYTKQRTATGFTSALFAAQTKQYQQVRSFTL